MLMHLTWRGARCASTCGPTQQHQTNAQAALRGLPQLLVWGTNCDLGTIIAKPHSTPQCLQVDACLTNVMLCAETLLQDGHLVYPRPSPGTASNPRCPMHCENERLRGRYAARC